MYHNNSHIQDKKEELDTSVNNEFEKKLVENGYKFFKDNWKGSIRGFQKKITDKFGIKYFITGYHWNFGKTYNNAEDRDSYSFDVQFNLDQYRGVDKDGESICGKSKTIDIRFSADFLPNQWRPVTDLSEVEEFYEKCWNDMMADYYEYYYSVSEEAKKRILIKRRFKKN
jgi:hypothetical protein